MEVNRGVSLLMGMTTEEQPLRIPEPMAQDIPAWIALVSATQERFTDIDETGYEKQLAERIERGEAWLMCDGETIAVAMLPVGAQLSVVTSREGDHIGAETRAFYEAMGFATAEELNVFNLLMSAPDRHRAGLAAGQIKSRKNRVMN